MGSEGELERGRVACGRRDWATAFAALWAADGREPLGPEDLELCATAAYMLGRSEDFRSLLVRSYRDHLGRGDRRSASRSAFWLGFALSSQGETAQGSAWLSRARKQLSEEPEDCVERGYVALPEIERLLASGEFESAFERAAEVVAFAERFGDGDLRVFALHAQAVALLKQQRILKGLVLLDEAMLSVTADEVSPVWAGITYCSAITACRGVLALDRMREWTGALQRWCDSQPDMVAFVGECRVLRAELLQLHGDWHESQSEVERVLAMTSANARVLGAAWYQVGELRRLRGELEAAEQAYREALALGFDPQPGLAQLWLAQGKVPAAAAALERALVESAAPHKRSRLLQAHVQARLAIGDSDEARRACAELAAMAERLRPSDTAPASGETLETSPVEPTPTHTLLDAVAAECAGLTAVAEGNFGAALTALRRASDGYRFLGMPYEAARTHRQAALICREMGDVDSGSLELEAALTVYRELGAVADAREVEVLLGRDGRTAEHPLTSREIQVLALVADGLTNRAIAGELGLSVKTVDRHVSNIFDKLEVPSRAAAAVRAAELGLLGGKAAG